MFEDQFEEKPSKRFNKKRNSDKYQSGHSFKYNPITTTSKKSYDRLFNWTSHQHKNIDEHLNRSTGSNSLVIDTDDKQTFMTKNRLHFEKCQKDREQYAVEYSLNKRNRWNTIQQLECNESSERLEYMSENSYSVFIVNKNQRKLDKENIPEGRTFCDRNGKLRKNTTRKRTRSDKLTENQEIKKSNNELNVENMEIMYEVYHENNTFSKKPNSENENFQRRRRNRIKLETYKQYFKNEADICKNDDYTPYDEDDDDFEEFDKYLDDEYSPKAPTNMRLSDFFTTKKLKNISRKSSKTKSESQDRNSPKRQVIFTDQIPAYHHNGTPKYDQPSFNVKSSTFEFYLPSISSLSLSSCDHQDIPIMDSQSSPPLYLLDFSSHVQKILLARGDISKRKNLVRALGLMKFDIQGDIVKVSMIFNANIASSNSLPTQVSSNATNFKEIIDEMKQMISDWLKDAILINVLDFCDSFKVHKRLRSSGKELLNDYIPEQLGIHRQILSREDIFYKNLMDYWKIKKSNGSIENTVNNTGNNNTLTCNICLMEMDKNTSLALKCNHQFCVDCWKNHLMNKLKACCPEFDCEEPVELPVFYSLFGYLLTYRVESFNVFEMSIGRWLSCKNTDCNFMIKMESMKELPMVECLCSENWCFNCEDICHWPSSCKQHKIFNQYHNYNQKTLNKLSGVIVQVKSCPVCKRKFEKNGGCNSMVCNCGTNFCWNCTKLLKNHMTCTLQQEERIVIVDNQYFHNKMSVIADSCFKSLKLPYKSEKYYKKLFHFYKDQFEGGNEYENECLFINLMQTISFQCYKEQYLIKNVAVFLGAFDTHAKIPSDIYSKIFKSRYFLCSAYYRIKKLKNSLTLHSYYKPELSLRSIENLSRKSSQDMKELIKMCYELEQQQQFKKYILDSVEKF